MTDAEAIQQFLLREQRWVECLGRLREFHRLQLGKSAMPIQWIADRTLGRFSWLGFYWHQEMLWFGYGLYERAWRPLIEVDRRSAHSAVWGTLVAQLGGTWARAARVDESGYKRLWAPPDIEPSSEAEFDWLKARSCELHEYLVVPEW